MRIQSTMTDLTEVQWAFVNATVLTSYPIDDLETRVCLTIEHGEQERHVEMPMGSYISLLTGVRLIPLSQTLSRFRENVRASMAKVAEAALTPDALPDHLEKARSAADPARKPGQTEAPCEHGLPVVEVTPSLFHDEPPVRTHADGCQSYGPYAQ